MSRRYCSKRLLSNTAVAIVNASLISTVRSFLPFRIISLRGMTIPYLVKGGGVGEACLKDISRGDLQCALTHSKSIIPVSNTGSQPPEQMVN